MTAQLIDGLALSRQIRAQVGQRVAHLTAAGRRPGLAVILVGDDPASAVYVRNKVKACADHGLHSVLEQYGAELSEADLLSRVAALNADPAIHGVLVQMPLPLHIDPHKVIEAIDTRKDVDGFSVHSAGALMAGLPGLRPATPYGCMKLIESTGQSLRGKHAVVIGRSNTVGKPMALLLLQAHATVTVCHSATPDLAHHCARADVLVAAVRALLDNGADALGGLEVYAGPVSQPAKGKQGKRERAEEQAQAAAVASTPEALAHIGPARPGASGDDLAADLAAPRESGKAAKAGKRSKGEVKF